MKISELIDALQHQRNLYGDLPVYHDRGGEDEFCLEEIESVDPVHEKDKNWKEDTSQPPWAIELR